MVRVCNFLVFFLLQTLLFLFTLYLMDLYTNEGKLTRIPKRLKFCAALYFIGAALLVVSQFTGLYYTIDETNTYVRSPGYIICFLIPLLIITLQLSVVIQYRRRLSHYLVFSLLLNTAFPLAASIIQIFAYGLSLTNIMIVGMTILLYVYALLDLNQVVEQARKKEIEFYRTEQEKEHVMFEETAEALASAIDAKDTYTRGHSARVAEYALEIAKAAGKNEEECEEIFFAGLLHDVGKIGIDDDILNKNGRLTDQEFEQIRLHPVYGNQILSGIHHSPYLGIGSRHHHERYDGKGYPDHLKGTEIPEIARIIAVADAYDAMTSKRSYRDPIACEEVRKELTKGMGSQFDPRFAGIMLEIMEKEREKAEKRDTQREEKREAEKEPEKEPGKSAPGT